MQQAKPPTKKAFTIIELAIVIIGVALLYGAIQAGKKMISKTQNLVTLNQADNAWEEPAPAVPDEVEVTYTLPATSGNLALWLDATSISTISKTDNVVTQWRDKSGNGLVFNASGAPIRDDTTKINDLFGISLDGIDDYFSTNGDKALETTNGNYMIFVVMRIDIPAVFAVFSHSSFASDNVNNWSGGLTDKLRHDILPPDGGGGVGGSYVAGDLVLGGYGRENWNGKIFQNGSLVKTGALETYSGTSSLDAVIGGRKISSNAFTNIFGGVIAEIIIYSDYLSDTDRQAVETYLNDKWSIY